MMRSPKTSWSSAPMRRKTKSLKQTMTMKSSGRPRAVLCLSGGMDSCVCAALAARDYDVYALHFSYGQRTEARELLAAASVAQIVGAKDFLHLDVDIFRKIG